MQDTLNKTRELTENMSWIETYDGGNFDFDNPDNSTIRITDIAVALSRIPRFNGHSLFHYTVGQHCVLMEKALRKLYPAASPIERLHVILHDAAEAYIGDMARPLKYLPDMIGFRRMETLVTAAIYKKLDVPQPTPEQAALVKEYDDRMLRTEAEALMTRLKDWRSVILLDPLPVPVKPWTESRTKTAFLQSYNDAMTDYRSDLLKDV
jgi:hypothetical protein